MWDGRRLLPGQWTSIRGRASEGSRMHGVVSVACANCRWPISWTTAPEPWAQRPARLQRGRRCPADVIPVGVRWQVACPPSWRQLARINGATASGRTGPGPPAPAARSRSIRLLGAAAGVNEGGGVAMASPGMAGAGAQAAPDVAPTAGTDALADAMPYVGAAPAASVRKGSLVASR